MAAIITPYAPGQIDSVVLLAFVTIPLHLPASANQDRLRFPNLSSS